MVLIIVSLLQDKQAKAVKKASKEAKATAAGVLAPEASRWARFDREKDLKIPPRQEGSDSKRVADFLRGSGGLNSRFGSGSNKFL